MTKGVQLSPKHGLNPTMLVCFWCGQPTGEIAMLGKLKGDVEAPKYSIAGYTPCEKCAEKFNKGQAILEVKLRNEGDSLPPIGKQPLTDRPVTPTGRFVIINTGNEADNGKVALMIDREFTQFMKDHNISAQSEVEQKGEVNEHIGIDNEGHKAESGELQPEHENATPEQSPEQARKGFTVL